MWKSYGIYVEKLLKVIHTHLKLLVCFEVIRAKFSIKKVSFSQVISYC